MIKTIIDEENVSSETPQRTNDLFDNSSLKNLGTSTPVNINAIETDDSFHSAVGEDDTEPLIVNMDTTETNEKILRKALGCIQNRLVETPKAEMRRKLWRNMKDERIKKGVNIGLENTPPLPFNDITSSAPPKLYKHRKYT